MHLTLRLKLGLLAAALAITTCANLGLWQLDRANEKALWLENKAIQQRLPPVSLTKARESEENLIRVSFTGKPDNSRHLLLDNRIHKGIAGYHLLTAVNSNDGNWVLVNRGWLARGLDRQTLPEIPSLAENVSISGQTYRHSDKVFTLADDDLSSPSWPLRIQKLDIPTLSEAMQLPLLPFEIRLSKDAVIEQGDQLARPWNDASTQRVMGPEKHRAYALQWFTMAAAFFLIIVISLWRGYRASKHSQDDS